MTAQVYTQAELDALLATRDQQIAALQVAAGQAATATAAEFGSDENRLARLEAAVAALTPAPVSPPAPASLKPVPPAGCWFGAYTGTPDSTAASDAAYAQRIGVDHLAVATTYWMSQNGPGIAAGEAARVKRGTVPMVSMNVNVSDTNKGWTLADVAAGKYDSTFLSRAKAFGALGGPMLISLNQEPDVKQAQNIVTGTTADWLAAYRHVHDLMAPAMPNAAWLYWMGGGDATLCQAMYPGDDYVDWVGADPYKWKWHPTAETCLQTWQPASDLMNRIAPGKPHMLPETGVDVTQFGDAGAAAWWAGMPAAAKALNLKAIVHFDRNYGSPNWLVDNMPQTVAALKTAVAQMG